MPNGFVWDAVKGLFQVKECHVDRLGLLTVLLQKQPSTVNGVHRSTPFHKATLVWNDGNNLVESGFNNPFKYFHGMTQEPDQLIIQAFRHIILALSNWHHGTGCPDCWGCTILNYLVKEGNKNLGTLVAEDFLPFNWDVVGVGCLPIFLPYIY